MHRQWPKPGAAQNAASLPTYPDETGRFAVPISVQGQEFRFYIDTGAHRHTMASAVAEILKASRKKVPGTPEKMTGGEPLSEYTTVKELTLGGLKTPEMTMYILSNERLRGKDGLLASDLWSHFDVELDYANGRLNLFEPCSGRAAYWAHSDGPITIPFTLNSNNHIHVAGTLGDRPIDIRVDTGGSETTPDISRMSYFGLSPSSPGVRDMGNGLWYRYTFPKLEFGPLSIPNANVAFVSGTRSEVFVGSDILRRYHVLISYKDKTITLTKPSDDPAVSAALGSFNGAYFAAEDHQWEKTRDLYGQALANPALPASYRAAAYFGRSQSFYRLKQCPAAVSDLKAATELDAHISDSRRSEPNWYVQTVQKNCPGAP